MARRKISGTLSESPFLPCFPQNAQELLTIPDTGTQPVHIPGYAGVDEAGRGCLAGPVVAAAVLLPGDANTAPCLIEAFSGLTDSKKLSPTKREKLTPRIQTHALAWGLGLSWPQEIDTVNILQATFLAMARALRKLWDAAGLKGILIDGNHCIPTRYLPKDSPPQHALIKGDNRVLAIAAASVLAKTFRDKLMTALDKRYPGYGFAEHKGYGTQNHRKAILQLGASPMHRHTFAGAHGPRDHNRGFCKQQGKLC